MKSPTNKTSVNVKTYNPKAKTTNIASQQLQNYVSKNLEKEIPVALITGLSNLNGRMPISTNNRYLQRLTNPNGLINTDKLLASLKTEQTYVKGQPLSDNAIKNIFLQFSKDGQVSHQTLMRVGQQLGVPISEKTAKLIIRKYGKSKGYLTADDCSRLNVRRQNRAQQNLGGNVTSPTKVSSPNFKKK